jgi:hypothetical protein
MLLASEAERDRHPQAAAEFEQEDALLPQEAIYPPRCCTIGDPNGEIVVLKLRPARPSPGWRVLPKANAVEEASFCY